MSTILRVKSQAMIVSLRAPCRLGSARKEGRSTIVSSGAKLAKSSTGGRIRRLRMNSECHAYSVKTRARKRNAGSAPPWRSCAKSVLPFAWAMKSARSTSKCSSGHRIVVVPPHDAFRVRVAHYELVLGAASGMRARIGDERATGGDLRLVALQRVLVELRRAEVPVDRFKVAEAEPVRAEVEIMHSILDHPEHSPFKGAPETRCAASTILKVCRRYVATIWRAPGIRFLRSASLPQSTLWSRYRSCAMLIAGQPRTNKCGAGRGIDGARAAQNRTRNASALGDRERPDRGRLGRRNLVLFCNWPVEDRFRLVRPRRLPQLPLRCSQP